MPHPSHPDRTRARTARRWCADLAMGARFAVTGGREGWIRTALSALGVGLGVVVLLLASAVPNALNAAMSRQSARTVVPVADGTGPSDRSLLTVSSYSDYRELPLYGRVLAAEGPHPPVPPGLSRLPGPGEMAASPALADLLSSPKGALLKGRFAQLRITATIGDEGLTHPGELFFYQGSDTLPRPGPAPGNAVERISAFGEHGTPFRAGPLVVLSILVCCVALLTPVTVFIATAVRFGGERRDRRLAALRLVGADRATTRRIAAGEALAGALFGLLTGAALFLAVRAPLAGFSLFDLGVFPADVVPDTALVCCVAAAVPFCSVGVTLFALRRVAMEPLGVTRTAPPLRRRLWWRVLLPAAGVALLLPQVIGGQGSGDAANAQVIVGMSLLLLGVAALLPWLLDAVVARLGRAGFSSPSWHLAVRRLQLSGATTNRSVSGITVAVAGAVAVQVLLNGTWSLNEQAPGPAGPRSTRTPVRCRPPAPPDGRPAACHRRCPRGAPPDIRLRGLRPPPPGPGTHRTRGPRGPRAVSGDRRRLRHAAPARPHRHLFRRRCLPRHGPRELRPAPGPRHPAGPRPGRQPGRPPGARPLDRPAKRPSHHLRAPRPPPRLRRPRRVRHPRGAGRDTAAPPRGRRSAAARPAHPDAIEYVRNTAARISVRTDVVSSRDGTEEAGTVFRLGLTASAAAVLLLIGCGLLISTLEQLRDRARMLSALAALGTPRAVLGRSVLWQTAVPVALGLTLAVGCGLSLGALLLHMADRPLRLDWWGILTLTGTATAVVLGITALSLPPLWRLMRPDGLRTE
ncbi:hypothetical protein Srufu_028230 [Streptomyces libani subsp. rufus]|nr:hypothetical protein Srufu_028230 [Streptomyces libani subsp. rufus]